MTLSRKTSPQLRSIHRLALLPLALVTWLRLLEVQRDGPAVLGRRRMAPRPLRRPAPAPDVKTIGQSAGRIFLVVYVEFGRKWAGEGGSQKFAGLIGSFMLH